MSHGVTVIVNPAAGKGRGSRTLGQVRSAFATVGVSDIRTTSSAGEEARLATLAIQDGCTTIVAVGGDGTWSNVADAILASGAPVRLAVIAAGTGNDFAKNVGAPATDITATARLAVDGPDTPVDVGRVDGRYFINVSGFGFNIAVLEDVANVTWPRGDLLYLYGAVRQLFRYRGLDVDVASAAARRGATRHLMLMVANGARFGGIFQIAPGARLTDGQLDAVAFLDAPPLRRMRLLGAVTRGSHIGVPGVVTERSPAFTLTFREPPAYETDGEYRRATSTTLEIRCVPQALRVVTPSADTLISP
jgi:diacylglycerol kinase (ATP)